NKGATWSLPVPISSLLPSGSTGTKRWWPVVTMESGGNVGIDLDRQALSRVIIHDVQHAKPPPRAECVGHEVHRPHLVGCHGLRQGLAYPAFPSTLAPQRQLFLYVQPVHPLVIHLPAFALQQDAM